MLFSAKFSKLEMRSTEKSTFFIAHCSFDKTPILFFKPTDYNLFETLEMLCEHNERLQYYVFKVNYKNYKTKTGSYQSYFSIVGFDSCNTTV